MTRANPVWLDLREFANGAPLNEATCALVVDLDDPMLAPFTALAPTARDLDDMAGPLAGPRRYFLARRALLRSFVAMRLKCRAGEVVIGHDGNGAPRVLAPGPSVFASVTARGSIAGMAVADTPVGIDIEPHDSTQEPVWTVLHPAERAFIETQWREHRDAARFIETWAAKEAYLKAIGLGLKRDPATIAARFDGAGGFSIEDDAEPGTAQSGVHGDIMIGGRSVCRAVIALEP